VGIDALEQVVEVDESIFPTGLPTRHLPRRPRHHLWPLPERSHRLGL